jgi:hypothetical protein
MLNTDTIHVTQELLALLSEIDEFKGAWRALGTIAPERLNALRRVATIESIGSPQSMSPTSTPSTTSSRHLAEPTM